jgi:hypothetical protein
MVLLLIVDLGLAAAGGVLLSKGLATKDAKSAPAPAEKKSVEREKNQPVDPTK